MNKVFLIGRLTRDPELRYTGSNLPVATFTLAVNRNYTSQAGEREADFLNVVVWRKQAENVKNYLNQGSQVAVEGRIQTRNYDDQEGKRHYITEIIADNVQFLDAKGSKDNSIGASNTSQDVTPNDFPETLETTSVKNDPFADFGASIEISDDELPF